MFQDIFDRARPRVGVELEILIAKGAPDCDHLVGLACVGIERMLEHRMRRAGHPALGNCRVLVIHWNSVLLPSPAIFPGRRLAATTVYLRMAWPGICSLNN